MKSEKLINHLRAGFSLFWLKTHEPHRVRTKIYEEITSFQRKDGLQYEVKEWVCSKGDNPAEQIKTVTDSQEDKCTVLFLYNFHWFIEKPMIIQAIQDALPVLSSKGCAIVIVSPKVAIPLELDKDCVLMEMDLPNEEEIQNTISYIAPEESMVPEGKELQQVVSACKSLTDTELRQVLALSLVETEGERFSVEVINDYRAQAIQKSGFLEVLPGDITFDDVIGYDAFKRFVLETSDKPEAKGVMTIGAPGCGKTSIMKAIVGETKKFGLAVNMGKLFSKFQGETDANINMTIDIICALGNVFVLIDEFEKQFAGAKSDGTLDSGTTRRATGRWLDFLQNRPQGVYVCGTANSFVGIPPEYLRPGRWDTSPFHIDLPKQETRHAILKHYMKKKGLKDKKLPVCKDFTGAEIEALCHIASMRGLSLIEASKCIIPQIKTMGDDIEAMRSWAKDRCISAEEVIEVKANDKRKIDL
jgi:SpoVK/Ycf46/Vps4 family AAA+-type ATPase